MKQTLSIILFTIFLFACYCINKNIPKSKILASTILKKKLNHNYIHMDFNIANVTVEKMHSTTMHEMIHTFKHLNFIQYDIPFASAFGFYTEINDTKFISTEEYQNAFNEGMNADYNIVDSLIDKISEQYRNVNQIETKESYIDGALMAGLLKQKFPNFETGEAFSCLMCLGMGMDSKSCDILLVNDALRYIFNMKNGVYNQFNNEYFLYDTRYLPDSVKNVLNDYKTILQDFCVIITKDNVGPCITPIR